MNMLREWAVAVCAACIAVAVMQSMLPQNGLQKIFNLAASAFFLVCLLSPLKLLNLQAAPAYKTIESNQLRVENSLDEVIRRQALGAFGAEVKKLVASTSQKLGVLPLEVEVFINNGEADSISINEIIIKLKDEDAKFEPILKNEVKAATGKDPQVVYAAE